MLAHDDKAEFTREEVWRAAFLVGVPNIPWIYGNPNRLKWSWGNWDPHLTFGRERGTVASRFLAVTTPAWVSYVCWKIEFQITLKTGIAQKKRSAIFMHKKRKSKSKYASRTYIHHTRIGRIDSSEILIMHCHSRVVANHASSKCSRLKIALLHFNIDLIVDWRYTRTCLSFPCKHPSISIFTFQTRFKIQTLHIKKNRLILIQRTTLCVQFVCLLFFYRKMDTTRRVSIVSLCNLVERTATVARIDGVDSSRICSLFDSSSLVCMLDGVFENEEGEWSCPKALALGSSFWEA